MEEFTPESKTKSNSTKYRDSIAEKIKRVKSSLGRETAQDVLSKIKSSEVFQVLNNPDISADQSDQTRRVLDTKRVLESAGVSPDAISFDNKVLEVLGSEKEFPNSKEMFIIGNYFQNQKTSPLEHATNPTRRQVNMLKKQVI